jgi:hypothetical protein
LLGKTTRLTNIKFVHDFSIFKPECVSNRYKVRENYSPLQKVDAYRTVCYTTLERCSYIHVAKRYTLAITLLYLKVILSYLRADSCVLYLIDVAYMLLEYWISLVQVFYITCF